MLPFQSLADWLAARVTADYQPGSEVPDVVAPYVMLTAVPGPGLSTDGATNREVWQVRCAAAQGDTEAESYTNSETLAKDLDDAILKAVWPAAVGATQVIHASRWGSPPRMHSRYDDETVHFVASYMFETPSGL